MAIRLNESGRGEGARERSAENPCARLRLNPLKIDQFRVMKQEAFASFAQFSDCSRLPPEMQRINIGGVDHTPRVLPALYLYVILEVLLERGEVNSFEISRYLSGKMGVYDESFGVAFDQVVQLSGEAEFLTWVPDPKKRQAPAAESPRPPRRQTEYDFTIPPPTDFPTPVSMRKRVASLVEYIWDIIS